MEGGIRWLRFNEGIRWLIFNAGRRKWIRKGKEDKARESTREGGSLVGGIFLY